MRQRVVVNDIEIWIPVFNRRWIVSSWGRVAKATVENGIWKAELLTISLRNGYERVWVNGKARSVHKLVASAFLGKCPNGYEVNHRDLVKRNNKVSNLEYLTHSQNITHAGVNGHGGNGGKLTQDQRQSLVGLWASGKFSSYEKLGNTFGVSGPAVRYWISRSNSLEAA